MVFKLFDKKTCKRNVKLETTPFQRKVMLTLQNLQGNRRYHGGASIKNIESFLAQNFKVDGDTESQVKIALDQLVQYGTVKVNGELYTLIGQYANVSLIPSICKERVAVIRRIERIFPTTWDYCDRSKNDCNQCKCKSSKCTKTGNYSSEAKSNEICCSCKIRNRVNNCCHCKDRKSKSDENNNDDQPIICRNKKKFKKSSKGKKKCKLSRCKCKAGDTNRLSSCKKRIKSSKSRCVLTNRKLKYKLRKPKFVKALAKFACSLRGNCDYRNKCQKNKNK